MELGWVVVGMMGVDRMNASVGGNRYTILFSLQLSVLLYCRCY